MMSGDIFSHGPASAAVALRGGVTARAIGIETKGGTFTPLISSGTAVPCLLTEVFTTADDDQRDIKIRVLEVDDASVAEARLLGAYEVMLPQGAPRGIPQVEVTFAVGMDGVFRLSARDGFSGRDLRVATA
jgi:molecular chaperone DnaK